MLEAFHIKHQAEDVYLRNRNSAKPAVFQTSVGLAEQPLSYGRARCECWRHHGNAWQRAVDALERKHAA